MRRYQNDAIDAIALEFNIGSLFLHPTLAIQL
jgi:hypothetical protein